MNLNTGIEPELKSKKYMNLEFKEVNNKKNDQNKTR